MKKNPDLMGDPTPEQDSGRKVYEAPVIVHEAEMETRAGSPLFAGDPARDRNPWDPDYGSETGR